MSFLILRWCNRWKVQRYSQVRNGDIRRAFFFNSSIIICKNGKTMNWIDGIFDWSFLTCTRLNTQADAPSSFSGSSVKQIFFLSLLARVTTDALKYIERWRCEWEKEATCSTIWNIREREGAKDISQHISCFLSLSHEDRKCVRRSNLILLSRFFMYVCQREEKNKKNARRTPQG